MYFAETYFWQVSVPAALIICELLPRPHMILLSMEKHIYFPYMHSLYCYIFYKHELENIRFVEWILMYFHFIIFSHFMGVTAIIRMCELGQENVQPIKRPR